MENPQKVQLKINELNAKEPRDALGRIIPQWAAIQGYFALTGFNYNNGSPIFNANFGVPVKIFQNSKTGEIKIYGSNIFEG
jgi:hypothetical protein